MLLGAKPGPSHQETQDRRDPVVDDRQLLGEADVQRHEHDQSG